MGLESFTISDAGGLAEAAGRHSSPKSGKTRRKKVVLIVVVAVVALGALIAVGAYYSTTDDDRCSQERITDYTDC